MSPGTVTAGGCRAPTVAVHVRAHSMLRWPGKTHAMHLTPRLPAGLLPQPEPDDHPRLGNVAVHAGILFTQSGIWRIGGRTLLVCGCQIAVAILVGFRCRRRPHGRRPGHCRRHGHGPKPQSVSDSRRRGTRVPQCRVRHMQQLERARHWQQPSIIDDPLKVTARDSETSEESESESGYRWPDAVHRPRVRHGACASRHYIAQQCVTQPLGNAALAAAAVV